MCGRQPHFATRLITAILLGVPNLPPETIVRTTVVALLALLAATANAQNTFSDMRWREIGPTRAGRARAVAGVPSQPNVA